MFEALDAELLILVGDRRVGRAGDGDIGAEIDLALQRIGEIEADAGIGGLVVDLVIEDAEAVFLAQILISGAHVGIVLAREAGVIGVKRDAPGFVARLQIAERRQRFGLRWRALGVLIGGVGGGRGVGEEFVAAFRLGVVGGLAEPCERQPRRRVLRR